MAAAPLRRFTLFLCILPTTLPPRRPLFLARSEQLTAFELWLEHGGPDKKPPEQLPIVLQASGS